MSLSNIEYSVLKKRAGLHNRGFMSARDDFDTNNDEMEEMDAQETDVPQLLYQNSYGEFYALQDFDV